MTTATQTPPAAAASDVLDVFQVTDADEVRAFLAAYPFLEPPLSEVAALLPKYFHGAPLRLQVEVEYESSGRPRPQLVVVAVVAGWTPDAARDAMDAFDEQCWVTQSYQVRRQLIPILAFG